MSDHDEAAHARGELCKECVRSISALPAFACPDCGSTKVAIDSFCGIVGWMTCEVCGWRKHGQSGRTERR